MLSLELILCKVLLLILVFNLQILNVIIDVLLLGLIKNVSLNILFFDINVKPVFDVQWTLTSNLIWMFGFALGVITHWIVSTKCFWIVKISSFGTFIDMILHEPMILRNWTLLRRLITLKHLMPQKTVHISAIPEIVTFQKCKLKSYNLVVSKFICNWNSVNISMWF